MRGFAGGVATGVALGLVGLGVASVALAPKEQAADEAQARSDAPPLHWPGLSPEEQQARDAERAEAAARSEDEAAGAAPEAASEPVGVPEEAVEVAAPEAPMAEPDAPDAFAGALPGEAEGVPEEAAEAVTVSPVRAADEPRPAPDQPDLAIGAEASPATPTDPASLAGTPEASPFPEPAPIPEPAPPVPGAASTLPPEPVPDEIGTSPETPPAMLPSTDAEVAVTAPPPPAELMTPPAETQQAELVQPSLGDVPVAAPVAPDEAGAPALPQASAAAPPAEPPAQPGVAVADDAPAPVAPEPLPYVVAGEVLDGPAQLAGPSEAPAAPAGADPELALAQPSSPAASPLPETAPASDGSAAPRPDEPAVPSVAPAPDAAAPAPSAPTGEAVAMAAPMPASPVGEVPDDPPAEVMAAPSEPTEPPAPGLVALEGGALPGQGAVPVNRLGLEAEAAPAPTPVPPAPLPEDAPALLRFAANWTAPAEPRPFLALVLLDDGGADPALVAALPMTVSVAVDPDLPDASQRAAAYRAAGVEVLALARLPPRPQPTDVEVFLGPALDRLPEAVAVLDLGEGGLRGRDATAEMALSRLARSGLGAVLASGGLGRGAEGAEAAGVPAAELLRDLDGDGQDGLAIRRQLDDAARRAEQDDGAVVLARLRPATIEALTAWTGDRRAGDVTLAPVSAVLSPEAPATP